MEWWIILLIVLGILVASPLLLILCFKIYLRLSYTKCRSTNRLDGKVVIVTGANSGIGKELTKALASRGARVIMACRNLQSANDAAEEIRKQVPGCQLSIKRLDLCSIQSVKTFAGEIIEEESKLDLLINNAGIVGGEFKTTGDGFEEIYQANYLGPFLLTELLVPLLKKSAPARIINTGSSGYASGTVEPQNLKTEFTTRNKLAFMRYNDTKLAMNMWTQALSEELLEHRITVNVVHPGVIATPVLDKNVKNFSNRVFRDFQFFLGRPVEEGIQTLLHISLDEQGGEITGRYWVDCKPSWVVKGTNKDINRQVVKVTREVLEL